MTATIEQARDQMMSLPDAERFEALLATLERSGQGFCGDVFHALESARRADELASRTVVPLDREQAFAPARRAIRSAP